MILVDTSAWVEFDRATGSNVDSRLTELIASSDAVAVTEPVIMEVLAGARNDRRASDLRRLLDRFVLLRFEVDAVVDFDGATTIHRTCRRRGVTPRGMIDCKIHCMIAAVALRHGVSLLAADADLHRVAGVMEIAIDRT